MKLTGIFKVKKIKKKTSAVFFKNLKVGDEFTLQYNLNGHYGSAPWIDIYKDGEHAHHNNALQLVTNLEKFEIEQVKIKARKCGVVKCPDCDGTGYDTFL